MTSAYILIAAIIVLGGLIAALGDRLGTKVGKARLRLFNLRPRQTAAVVTVITGTLIASSTLLLLFGLSESLREGVFQLDDILKRRRQLKAELARVEDEKEEVEAELQATKQRQNEAQEGLDVTNKKFDRAQNQLKTISGQASKLRQDIKSLLKERQQLNQQRQRLSSEVIELKEQINARDREISTQEQRLQQQETELQQQSQSLQLQKERFEQLQTQQSDLKAEIAERDSALQEKQASLADLEQQIAFLQEQVTNLERGYLELRRKDIAITRSQVLASAVVRATDSRKAQQIVDRIIQEANQKVLQNTLGSEGKTDKVIEITQPQVTDLINHIKDGREYVLRILSASNYVQGELPIRVFADALLNQKIFATGEVIATASVDSNTMSLEDIQAQLEWLMAASQFRARRAGIIGNVQVEDGNIAKLIIFIEQLRTYPGAVDQIRAIAPETIYTAGPLKIRLVAVHNGKVVLST